MIYTFFCFLINTTILCNKFNIQSFFRYNIKAKQMKVSLKQGYKRLKLQSGISEDMILFASLKYFPCPGYPYQWLWQDLEDHPKERFWRWDYHLVWVWRHTAPCSCHRHGGQCNDLYLQHGWNVNERPQTVNVTIKWEITFV